MTESANTNRFFAATGYLVNAGTTPVVAAFSGFTVIAEAVIAAIVAPTAPGPEGIAYQGDEANLAGVTLPAGYYPIRGSSLDLTSGSVIMWLE